MKNKKTLNYIFYLLIVINIIVDIIHIITSYSYAINGGCNYSMNDNIFLNILSTIIYLLPIVISFLYLYNNKHKIITVLTLIVLSYFLIPLTVLSIIYIKENIKEKNKFMTIIIGIISIFTHPLILTIILNSLLHYFNTDLFKIFNVDSWNRCFNGYDPYF